MEDPDDITEKRVAITPDMLFVPESVVPAEQSPHTRTRRLRWFYVFPILLYIGAVYVGTRATLLFLTNTKLLDILVQFALSIGVAFVGSCMLIVLLFAVEGKYEQRRTGWGNHRTRP